MSLRLSSKKIIAYIILIYKQLKNKKWCGAESNRRHKDFQSFALPTELPHPLGNSREIL